MKVLRAERYVAMPWKNGGGVTREIWREDDGAGGFEVRISLADVDADGPFSPFPGIDRFIVVTEGEGMKLSSTRWSVTLAPLVPFAFSGDDAVHARLVNGPTRDLNLMVKRGKRAALKVHRGVRLEVQGPAWVVALSDEVSSPLGGNLARYDALFVRPDEETVIELNNGAIAELSFRGVE